jgi:signal transduction histidine kinase
MEQKGKESLLSAFLAVGTVDDREKQVQFERIAEIFTWVVVIFSTIFAFSPLAPIESRNLNLWISSGVGVFALVWYRLIPRRFTGRIKNFIFTLFLVTLLAVLVHFSNGIQGYSVFFYYITIIRVGMSMSFPSTILVLFYNIFLLFLEANLSHGPLSSNLNLAALDSWGLALVTFFGRFYAGQSALTKKREEEVVLEKEKTVGRLKDEFVFIISHELKQPAVAIKGYIDSIFSKYGTFLDKESKEVLELTSINSERLTNLLNDLLDISRIEQDKMKVNLDNVFLKPAISEVLSSQVFEARNKKISLLQKGDLDTAVKADVDRLKEVLTNLISNAIKYTPQGGEVVVEVANEGDFAKVTVSDNGIGISPEAQKHLFEKFYRVENEKTKVIKGSGLGLFITKNLVEKMGGEIGFTSQLGKGTDFYFKLSRYNW